MRCDALDTVSQIVMEGFVGGGGLLKHTWSVFGGTGPPSACNMVTDNGRSNQGRQKERRKEE